MATLALAASLLPVTSSQAVTIIATDNGANWQVHDAAPPSLDTGSLRTVSQSPVDGFANIFVQVDTDPQPLFNAQMMRGFGLTYDGESSFASTQGVDLGGITIARTVDLDRAGDAARYLDSFTNTTDAAIEVDVSFGGALGNGTGNSAGSVVATSSGDDVIDPEDTWSVVATPNTNQRPVGLVIGTPGADASLTGVGNQERNPFVTPRAESGHEANFYGYLSTMTVEPGETRSLARWVLVGSQGDAAGVTDQLDGLVAAPDLDGLSPDQVCSIANWDLSAIDGFDPAGCPELVTVDGPAAADPIPAVTSVAYDVTNRSIEELQADMEAGVTTSEQITQAYLDRIAVYDSGPFGYSAFIHVADDALEQAKAADEARAAGATGDLLGIPIAIKDLFDTEDMPTTGGTRALEGWQPQRDSFQVAGLRAAGAVMIGKANMSEFARSGSYSESGWGQTWNALNPSKTSFGSSGGSATAVSASMAAAAMGSQTGVSLYAPSVGASLVTFRGTDGLASGAGVMPLTWGQDYGGPMTQTVTDTAYILNATTGTDPDDVWTVRIDADERRPDDYTDGLDADALVGKTIGYVPGAFEPNFADDGTAEATLALLSEIEAAGATVVEVPANPGGGASPPGNRGREGWARYIERHPDFPYADGNELYASPLVLPYSQQNLASIPRMTEEQVEAWFAYRDQFKDRIDAWMDEAGVDAVVYPGFLSDVYNNDSASNQNSSDRGTGIPVSAAGIPTVTVPVGVSPNGYSIAMQIVGRAFDDAAVLGYGYALEQQTQARLLTDYAPPLEVVSDGPGGPPDGAGPPPGVGRPEGAGPPAGVGRPEGAGPPDGAGPPAGVGRPGNAGPPPGVGRPGGAGRG